MTLVGWFDQAIANIATARAAIVKAAQNRRGVSGKTTCPVCGAADALWFSIAGRTGHVHARCSTEGCVRWME